MSKRDMIRLALMGLGLGGTAIAAAALAQNKEVPAVGSAEAPKAIVERACQGCHELGTLTQSPHSPGEWPGIVARMRSNGAELTDAEAKDLQAYLAATYSIKKP